MEEEILDAGVGNPKLASVCESLFYKNGNPALYSLSLRLGEPSYEFNKNCPLELFEDNGFVQ